MQGFTGNIEKLTLENNNFRKVIYTSKSCQLVLMSLKPGEEIGWEVHADSDQFFRFEKGTAKVTIDGTEHEASDGDAIIVPVGAKHNVVNSSATEPLKLYTIYAPPHHKDGTIHKTKEAAVTDTEHFDGQTTE